MTISFTTARRLPANAAVVAYGIKSDELNSPPECFNPGCRCQQHSRGLPKSRAVDARGTEHVSSPDWEVRPIDDVTAANTRALP